MGEKIKISFHEEEIIVEMYDHATSKDFMAMLPLTLTLEDYANTEKVSNLPKRLSTADAQAGMAPVAGDFTYYSPWGNLAIFYKNFGYADGLVPLGHIASGIEKLVHMTEDFTVSVEKLD